MVEKLKSFNPTFVLLALGCLFGGLKDGWFVFPSGILICVLLVLRLKRTGSIYISKKLNIIFLLLLFCAGLSIFEAISLGDTIGGLLKLVIIGIYIVWCMQMTEEEKTEAIADMPKLGILVMVASALLVFLPYFRDRMINKAGRLSGTIGYSNTLALIFLISLAVYLEHDKVESKQLNRDKSIYFSIMILGILWTGSRFTIVLTVLYLISLVIRRKKINRYYWLSIVVMLAVAYVYSMVSGNMRGIARIGTLFSNSSTLIGRIIYWKDGIKVLFEHPIGMGSMGWFLTQEATQSAPYVVKFVHNSFLQAGLDYGIGFMVLSVVLSVISIVHARENFRFILAIIYMHMFFEFDSEYMVVMFILILLVDDEWLEKQENVLKREKIILGVSAFALITLFLWQSAFWFLIWRNHMETALKLNPDNVLIETEVMTKEADLKLKYRYAKHILARNHKSGQAYDACAMYDADTGRVIELLKDGRNACRYQKYYMPSYSHYLMLLENAYLEGDNKTKELVVRGMQTLVDDLNRVRMRTDKLAYRTVDAPDFLLSYEALSILNKHGIAYD